MTKLIVTKESSGLDKYSQEIEKRIKISTIQTNRYFSLKELYRFFKVLRGVKDIIHLPNQHFARYAFFLKRPFIITVHDLTRICFNFEKETFLEKLFLKLDIKGIKEAEQLIAVSENTMNDLVKYLKIPKEKISVIYNGIDRTIFRLIKEGLYDFPYILYVGSERRRKNLSRLFEAFSKIRKYFKGLKLVKVGSAGRSREFRRETLKQIESLGLTREVIITDFVAEDKLPSYYSSASLFVYPSLYEGFGLPVLEAMACGCPVVASNTSSIPEVAGDAAILVNPYDVTDLAVAITKVLTDARLREEMIEKGLAQAKKFSWEKAAEETLKVYQKLEA